VGTGENVLGLLGADAATGTGSAWDVGGRIFATRDPRTHAGQYLELHNAEEAYARAFASSDTAASRAPRRFRRREPSDPHVALISRG
jgi:hypothetical protein